MIRASVSVWIALMTIGIWSLRISALVRPASDGFTSRRTEMSSPGAAVSPKFVWIRPPEPPAFTSCCSIASRKSSFFETLTIVASMYTCARRRSILSISRSNSFCCFFGALTSNWLFAVSAITKMLSESLSARSSPSACESTNRCASTPPAADDAPGIRLDSPVGRADDTRLFKSSAVCSAAACCKRYSRITTTSASVSSSSMRVASCVCCASVP